MLLALIPDLGKCPNQKTHEIRKYAYLRVFWFGHFPRSGIESESSPNKKDGIYSTCILRNSITHKNASGFDPGPREVPKPENTQIRVFAYFMCFLVRALPEVWDRIRKQFFDKVLYNYCSKIFCGAFRPKK